MSEAEEPQEFKTTPEEAHSNRRQVWLTLIVMLTSSCVGILVLSVILWFLINKVIPAGWL